jgi:hypothetical protein
VRRVLISDKLYERLVEEAGRRGLAVEELVAEILSKALNITLDPQDRAELHLGCFSLHNRLRHPYSSTSETSQGC